MLTVSDAVREDPEICNDVYVILHWDAVRLQEKSCQISSPLRLFRGTSMQESRTGYKEVSLSKMKKK